MALGTKITTANAEEQVCEASRKTYRNVPTSPVPSECKDLKIQESKDGRIVQLNACGKIIPMNLELVGIETLCFPKSKEGEGKPPSPSAEGGPAGN